MPYFTIAEKSLRYYYEIFEAALPRDTLLIHDNLASNLWWQSSIPFFQTAAQQHNWTGRVFCVEWLGCGESDPARNENDLQMPSMAADIVALINQVSSRNGVDVIGHSTGGLLALLAMAKAPDLFHRAILLNPVGIDGLTQQLKDNPEIWDIFGVMRYDQDRCAETMKTTIHNIDPKSDLFLQIVKETSKVHELNWHGVLKALNNVNFQQCLSIPHTCLILHGEHDTLIPSRESQYLAHMLPHGIFGLIPNQGHSWQLENPETFTETVRTFFSLSQYSSYLFDPSWRT